MEAATRTKAPLAFDPPQRAALQAWEITCLNCSSPLSGPYCSHCGQRAIPPHPSLAQIGGEAFAELSGWDGKIAGTLRLLILRPGKLTVEFLEGKRAQFISPLRLYLWCSVVYFVLAASEPGRRANVTFVLPGSGAAKGNIVGASTNANLTDADRKEIAEKVETAPRVMRPLIRRLVNDPAGLQADVFSSMPKALFGLLPVFAGILTLFYRKRRYGEHLFYAFHLHAFFFAALSLAALSRFTHALVLERLVGLVVLLWLPIYAHRSLKRVYGGSFSATMVKELGIGALYVIATIPALVLLAMWVAWRM